MASKLKLDRLLDYGYRILGRVKGVKQEIEQIILPKSLMEQIDKALSSSQLETAVFFFGKVKGRKLLATDMLIPREGDYERRTFGHVHVSPAFTLREFPRLEEKDKTLVATVHSHPIDRMSYGDVCTHLKVVRHYPYQLTGVYSNGKLFFYRFEDGIKETPHKTLDLSRFDRQARVLGEEGQLLISSTTISLIGVGGGNAKIAFDLASLGIGKLILIDPEVWEEHNRNRIFIPHEFVGRNKAESIKELIEKCYPDVEVEACPRKAQDVPEKVYSSSDMLLVGPDSLMTRVFCNRLSIKLKKPAVFPAAGIESKEGKLSMMGGSVQVVAPGSPCFECVNTIDQTEVMRETLDPETKRKLSEKYGLGELLKIPVTPSIASLNDVIGGIALWEIIKLITGIEPVVNFQVYDALGCEISVIKTQKRTSCPACSAREEGNEASLSGSRSDEEILNLGGVESWT
ncbi:MAG: HesA/MoeB/ThiF family protein [Nitrososphaerales archaeon]